MCSFHLFALYSTGGTFVPMKAEETQVFGSHWVSLVFVQLSRHPGGSHCRHGAAPWSVCPALGACMKTGKRAQTVCSFLAGSLGRSASMLCCCDTFPSHAWVTPVPPCASVSFCVTPRRLCIPAPLSCSCLRCNRKLDVESAWLPSPLAVAAWRRTGMPSERCPHSQPAGPSPAVLEQQDLGGWVEPGRGLAGGAPGWCS